MPVFVGVWHESEANRVDLRHRLAAFIAGRRSGEMELVIDPDGAARFTRRAGDQVEALEGSYDIYEDLLIVDVPRSGGNRYKLVLAGWPASTPRRIFGHLYLYSDAGLFNGWAVSFERDR